MTLVLFSSLVVHPNKLLIATGQTTGHDRREGRVRHHHHIKVLVDKLRIILQNSVCYSTFVIARKKYIARKNF